MSMSDQLNKLREEALADLSQATSKDTLEAWRVKYFGRNGLLPAVLEGMKTVTPEERPVVGKLSNEVKTILQNSFDEKKASFEQQEETAGIDFTMPGRSVPVGGLHVVNQVLNKMVAVAQRMGYSLAEGPEMETEWNNFDALNIPANHPARNEQDTFFIKDSQDHPKQGKYILRTHTSPVQVRTMIDQKPPIRIVSPGVVFRRDEIDATHAMCFYQFEGLVVDENIGLPDLKGNLEHFFKELIGKDVKVRFRPHFFPFTEPSFEVDFCVPGLKIRGKDWTEIGGCGMVDPAVFQNVGIDSEKYTGFAFGWGVERIAMILHEIGDLRLFNENDVRFLRQFH
jgi:phenylalanyl-tRNA synthetase alpha chain